MREQQLQNQLDSKIAVLEQEKSDYERHYEIIHDINLQTYIEKQKEILTKERDLKLEEIEQERQAKIADIAEMPTSSFAAMDSSCWCFVGTESGQDPLNFRVPAVFRREFKTYAASHDLKLNELLVKCFESYRKQQGD